MAWFWYIYIIPTASFCCTFYTISFFSRALVVKYCKKYICYFLGSPLLPQIWKLLLIFLFPTIVYQINFRSYVKHLDRKLNSIRNYIIINFSASANFTVFWLILDIKMDGCHETRMAKIKSFFSIYFGVFPENLREIGIFDSKKIEDFQTCHWITVL